MVEGLKGRLGEEDQDALEERLVLVRVLKVAAVQDDPRVALPGIPQVASRGIPTGR